MLKPIWFGRVALWTSACPRLGVYLILGAMGPEVVVHSARSPRSSMDINKPEIATRFMSTIISLALSNEAVVEEHAACTIANLAEMVELHDGVIKEPGRA